MIINGKEYDYRLNFAYERGNKVITNCVLERVESGGQFKEKGEIVGKGYATCDTRDQFSKKVGRKIALSRALLGLEINSVEVISNGPNLEKDERRVIWEAYLKKTK